MAWAGIALGAAGFFVFHRFREFLDPALSGALAEALRRIQSAFTPPPSPDEELQLAGRLISSLQAGLSLDAALELAREEAPPRSSQRSRLAALLEGAAPPASDFLGGFLHCALATGMPALASLSSMEKALRARRRLALKAKAVSANCRAQAEVLSWLPWVMAGAIALVDHDWFLSAARSSLSWFLWAMAVLICGFGRAWIRRSVDRSLRPRGEAERMEEEALPELVLRVMAEVSQGTDVETATERALAALARPALRRAFRESSAPRISRLRSTLQHALRTGAPVREELGAFLQDLQADLETRWEERVQRLPIALLGPLFLCFLPGSGLVLAGLLAPVFRSVL